MKIVFVAGGTGFVGSHLVGRLIKEGRKVRCLVRDVPHKLKRKSSRFESLKRSGVELAYGDITDYASLEEALKDVEKVIHLVGIIQESGKSTFKNIHVEGTKNLLKASLKNGIKFFLYQSALGADERSSSEYQRTKAEAEGIVKESGLPYIIFRPSLIFGEGDLFTLRLSNIIRKSPVIPVIGRGETRFQPIYIDDWVSCALKALDDVGMQNRVFEFGGPEHLTYIEIIDILSGVLKVQRYKVYVPYHVVSPVVKFMEKIIAKPPVTMEQLILLQQDNICDIKSVENAFGFKPITLKEGVQRFLKKSYS